MLRALRRGGPTTTWGARFASSLSSQIPLTGVESLVTSKDRTLLRVTQGGTVVLASLKARDDGRVGGGGLWVEFKERSFASSSAYRSVSRRHDVRAESLMTDEERGVASRIQRLVAVALVGVPAKQRVSVKLTVLAVGREDPEIVAVNAASALFEASAMSTCGPFGAARVAFDAAAAAAAESPLSVCDHLVSGDSMVVVCDGRGHLLSMRGVAAKPRSGEEIVEGLRAAQSYVRAYLTDMERKMGANMTRQKKSNVMVPGADPAAGRRVREQLEQRIAAHLAAQTGPGSVEGLYHHIESSIKPDVVEGLMRQGRWRHEASRIKGSGCVTAQDLDHTIRGIVQGVLRKRGDGSEDAVSAPSITLNHVSSLHAGSLYNADGAIVESAVTVVRGQAVEFPSSVSSVSSLEPSYNRGDGDDRVSSVFLTCAHGKPSVLNNNSNSSSYTASSDQLDDIDRAEFLRDAVSRMLPPPETLPFAFRTNSEVLANDARGGIGSVAAAVNGMSAAVTIALLDSLSHQKVARTKHVGKGGNGGRGRDRDKAHVMPWTAAAVGISYVYPPGTLDGEEHELAALEPPPIEGYNVLRDVSGLGSLVTDAELTVAGPCQDTDDKNHDEGSISGWMLQCHAPTRVTPEMVARGIEAAMDVREARRKVLHATTPSQDLPVFGELTVSTASMPKLLVDRAASLRKIEDATGGIIHVKAPGLLSLFASSSKAYAELEEHVSAASGAFLVPNRVYRAEVMAVLDFGAFVRLPKCDVEAMLHISEVKDERIGSINDELAVGDLIDVMYLGQDDQGGLRVSKRRVGGEQTRRRRGG